MSTTVLPPRLAPYDWTLYLVTDTAQCASAGRTVAQTVAAALAGGVGVVQVRDKEAGDAEVEELTREVLAAVADHEASTGGAPIAVFVDDRLEVVRRLREEGHEVHIHVGQTDEPVTEVRRVLGPEPLVGLSARTPAQFSAAAALRDGATGAALVDLLGIGPAYDTTTKEGAPAGLGPEGIADLAGTAAQMGMPAVGIGGITAERAPELAGAPLLGICVVSAICRAADPRRAAADIRAAYLSALPQRPPVALSIAGTDPSGGAGIQADLKAFTARGAYGTTVVTALVAQNTHGVSRVYPVDADFVADQFAAVLDDMPVDASKTGMLGSRELVELAADAAATRDLGFLTVDPVMVATSGHRLLEEEAVDAVRTRLTPLADLITPNLPEAALLLGEDTAPAADAEEQRAQAVELVRRGSRAVLLKGGHMSGEELLDVLAVRADETGADGGDAAGGAAAQADAARGAWERRGDVLLREFRHPKVATAHTHGTGCTLSAAITAEAAASVRAGRDPRAPEELAAVVGAGLDYLARALASGARWQLMRDPAGAHGPVDHLVDLPRR
ncbi:bifunctional hydroxymethylpyrimidine kinase/phosphomethylpyrimidine kinase [Brevibacterium album]|uniref:bifunctional hydroxymethylpyrimidine kinase/phosphomethylpyrimidine kinase n=1 Tax=Brevibacterium album TaxID=417948 RepID=UPI0004257741|nr:bifunctional hydroxymethylpyrimidine kinase/phosphomethylpyrimidine kinase [Brevibacterium album]